MYFCEFKIAKGLLNENILAMNDYKLTSFSPGAGCGCKIASSVLDDMLKGLKMNHFNNLLVGNGANDDAAVLDLGNGQALISTTDFFTPIVDDPYDFGRIAAANAISDIYAMGGTPVLAIAILGWPLEKIPAEVAGKVIEGATSICNLVNIPIAGGHSISISDPVFGLAVNGLVDIKNIKRNNTAKKGNRIFLTKPLGIGLISTAQKKSLLDEDTRLIALEQMTCLNKSGETYGKLDFVRAMTDVTGFGLIGHLFEMINHTELDAVLEMEKIPLIKDVERFIKMDCIPGGTKRNARSFEKFVTGLSADNDKLLFDPQTSGGLLVAVDKEKKNEFMEISKRAGQDLFEIGEFTDYSVAGENKIFII